MCAVPSPLRPRPSCAPQTRKAGLLRYFDVVVGRDKVAHGKPAPDLYLHAADQLGARRHCWAFEDSLPGLTAAVAAGAHALGARTSRRFMPMICRMALRPSTRCTKSVAGWALLTFEILTGPAQE